MDAETRKKLERVYGDLSSAALMRRSLGIAWMQKHYGVDSVRKIPRESLLDACVKWEQQDWIQFANELAKDLR